MKYYKKFLFFLIIIYLGAQNKPKSPPSPPPKMPLAPKVVPMTPRDFKAYILIEYDNFGGWIIPDLDLLKIYFEGEQVFIDSITPSKPDYKLDLKGQLAEYYGNFPFKITKGVPVFMNPFIMFEGQDIGRLFKIIKINGRWDLFIRGQYKIKNNAPHFIKYKVIFNMTLSKSKKYSHSYKVLKGSFGKKQNKKPAKNWIFEKTIPFTNMVLPGGFDVDGKLSIYLDISIYDYKVKILPLIQ